MFTSQSVKTIRRHLNRQSLSGPKYRGLSRRAISLMPAPQSKGKDVLTFRNESDWNRLSLAIEASQKSGCLLIQSEKIKSRSAMLIFRGRILSCMYRNKGQGFHVFGDYAFESAVSDLKSASKRVDVYPLPDSLVIAAASLFHGMILPVKATGSAATFDAALRQLVESNLPGCIVITGKKEPTVGIVYIFDGRIIGLHCSKRGWLDASAKEAQQYLARNKHVRIQACMLPCENVVEVLHHTFSPSGLDISTWEPLSPTFPVPQIFFLRRLDELHLRRNSNVVQMDRFFPHMNSSSSPNFFKRLHKLAVINHAFAICP